VGVDKRLIVVIPAKAGIPEHLILMDSRFHGNDPEVQVLPFPTPSSGEKVTRSDTLAVTRMNWISRTSNEQR
jgi:hypothetical protein